MQWVEKCADLDEPAHAFELLLLDGQLFFYFLLALDDPLVTPTAHLGIYLPRQVNLMNLQIQPLISIKPITHGHAFNLSKVASKTLKLQINKKARNGSFDLSN